MPIDEPTRPPPKDPSPSVILDYAFALVHSKAALAAGLGMAPGEEFRLPALRKLPETRKLLRYRRSLNNFCQIFPSVRSLKEIHRLAGTIVQAATLSLNHAIDSKGKL